MNIKLTCTTLALTAATASQVSAGEPIKLENGQLSREFSTIEDTFKSSAIVNKINGETLKLNDVSEFRLRISDDVASKAPDTWLSSNDFKVIDIKKASAENIIVSLQHPGTQLEAELSYTLDSAAHYGRKQLKLTNGGKKPVTVEVIELESFSNKDNYQPYKIHEINVAGKWSPGIGQPLYTKKSAMFFGVEFPASRNTVSSEQLSSAYYWGFALEPKQSLTTHPSVFGVGDDGEFIQEAFFSYIDDIRAQPLRVQIQYNSWFDDGRGVSRESFEEKVTKINEELVNKRKLKPLNAYVIDDGWQDSSQKAASDWNKQFWPVNSKFDPDFASTKKLLADKESQLGLWLSPASIFGAKKMPPILEKAGYERLDMTMSLAGPKYMDELEKRLVDLASQGVTYFKLDGLFGHLKVRNVELKPNRGVPIPNLEGLLTDDITPGSPKLDTPEFDELKMYYVSAGTARFIETTKAMREVNPELFIAITNSAYLSPWWLQYIDVIWLINSGDSAGGSDRLPQLRYRDGIYYEIWEKENTQFPMCSIFNHDPKKTDTGESREEFRDYLLMHMSRGSVFIELYLKTMKLSDADWDVLAESLQWAHNNAKYFSGVRMHGGDPFGDIDPTLSAMARSRQMRQETEITGRVYGYSAWNKDGGYFSVLNPSSKDQTYTVTLDRKLGLRPDVKGDYKVTIVTDQSASTLPATVKYGDELKIDLKSREFLLLEFAK